MASSRCSLAVLVAAACGAPPGAGDAGGPDAAIPIDAGAPDAAPDASACATRPDDAPCNDRDFCTTSSSCQGGACVGASPVECVPFDQCHVAGSCDPQTGLCDSPPAADGAACEDGSVCTAMDACESGSCRAGVAVDLPGDPCDDGICFTDVTAAAGIGWTADPSGTRLIGASAAWLDADGDGWLDAAIGAEGGSPRLYRNQGDGSFADVTAAAGFPALVVDDGFMGFAVADVDNDGDADVYLLFDGPNRLLVNDGAGAFTDATVAAGIDDGDRWSAAAAFGDYDGDGWLDLYVGNYIDEPNFPFHTPYPNGLYRNLGDGTFEDVTAASGTAGWGTTLATAWSDRDGDRQPELVVCNDFGAWIEPNRLYERSGGAFVEIGAGLGFDATIYCMGIAPGDYDRDGDLDYYFANLGRNVLLAQDGGAFADVTDAAGVANTYDACFTALYATSWSTGFFDFDADGWLDLFVSNGHIPAAVELANPDRIRSVLFRHDGPALAFTDVSHTAGIDRDGYGRGAAFGDHDADGDVDIVQVGLDGVLLWRNDSPAPGGAIQIDVRGRTSNRDGLGARVEVDVPGATLVREIAAQIGYLGSSERAAHVGVGAAAEATVRIRWPSGIDQTWLHVPAGTRALAVEPDATIESIAVLTDPVAEGAAAQVSVTLRNHTASPVTADLALTLRIAGQPPTTGAPVALPVPAAATATTTVGATVPTGVAPTTAELVVTATDAADASDQRAATAAVVP